MATVFFAWELGSGLGHVAQLAPLVKGLRGNGHRVFVALRDSSKAFFFEGTGTNIFHSPRKASSRGRIETPRTFAHVLLNTGFGDPSELSARVDAWSKLFDFTGPDLIVADHSPTALLAARGRKMKRVIIGNGFCCPPDHGPFIDLRPQMAQAPDELCRDEEFVLASANTVLQQRGAPRLERLAQLYGDVDQLLLTTFPEFDHYSDRMNGCYRGPWAIATGDPPVWPSGTGKRIYAYLSPCPALAQLLRALRETGYPTILSCGNLGPRIREQFPAANIRFEPRSLNLKQVGAETDVAVLNGNHATTILMLLAGKPVLQAPIFLEQAINARATERLQAGLSVVSGSQEEVAVKLMTLLQSSAYAEAARCFASKYARFDSHREICEAIASLEGMLASP